MQYDKNQLIYKCLYQNISQNIKHFISPELNKIASKDLHSIITVNYTKDQHVKCILRVSTFFDQSSIYMLSQLVTKKLMISTFLCFTINFVILNYNTRK